MVKKTEYIENEDNTRVLPLITLLSKEVPTSNDKCHDNDHKGRTNFFFKPVSRIVIYER
jgi:hypothetical protein